MTATRRTNPLDIFGEAICCAEFGRSLTCDEFEAMYMVLMEAGCADAARSLKDDHYQGEYPEDRHYDPELSEHGEDETW